MEVNHEHIKQLRLDKGWTQQQLADVTNLSLRTVQRIEKLGVASLESINALCSVFGVSRTDLLSERDHSALRQVQTALSLRQKLTYVSIFTLGVLFGSLLTHVLR